MAARYIASVALSLAIILILSAVFPPPVVGKRVEVAFRNPTYLRIEIGYNHLAERAVSIALLPWNHTIRASIKHYITFNVDVTELEVSGFDSCKGPTGSLPTKFDTWYWMTFERSGDKVIVRTRCSKEYALQLNNSNDDFYVVVVGDVNTIECDGKKVPMYELYGRFGEPINQLLEAMRNAADNVWRGIGAVFGWIVEGFVGAITAFIDFVKGLASAFVAFFEVVRSAFDVLVRGIGFIAEAIGRPGDPAYYNDVMVKLGAARMYVQDPELRSKVDAVLAGDCSVKLSEVADVYPKLRNDGRTICDVRPSGFLGMVSGFFAAMWAAGPVVAFIFKNFLLIHVLLFFATLFLAAAACIKSLARGGLTAEPIVKWAEAWGKYFNLYVRLISWIINKVIAFAQFIAELLPL